MPTPDFNFLIYKTAEEDITETLSFEMKPFG